jgi:hypothetical protein
MFCGTIHADPDVAIKVHMSNHIVGTVCWLMTEPLTMLMSWRNGGAALTRLRDKENVPRPVEDRMRHCRFVGAKHSGGNQQYG